MGYNEENPNSERSSARAPDHFSHREGVHLVAGHLMEFGSEDSPANCDMQEGVPGSGCCGVRPPNAR